MREERGWSQDFLAEKADVSRQTVSNWENDKVQIDAEKLKRLAEVFGVGMDELYDCESTAKEKKTKPLTLVFSVLAIVVALVSLVLAIVGICTADDNGFSSAIVLSGSAWLYLVAVIALAVLIFCTVLIVKIFKKK